MHLCDKAGKKEYFTGIGENKAEQQAPPLREQFCKSLVRKTVRHQYSPAEMAEIAKYGVLPLVPRHKQSPMMQQVQYYMYQEHDTHRPHDPYSVYQ